MTGVTGKDLIALGFRPAPWFGDVLRDANERRLSVSQAARLAQSHVDAIAAAEAERLAREMPLRSAPNEFQVNITAENEAEAANVAAVHETFSELMRTPIIEAGVVMPDACPAGPVGTIPVGGVIAARNAIMPGAHSADICCSMTATVVDGATPGQVLDAVHSVAHFGPGGRKAGDRMAQPAELIEAFADNPFLNNARLRHQAEAQYATSGDGNHFCFVGVSEATGKTVLVTHFGSRGPGASLYKSGMAVAERFRQNLSPETLKQNAWIPFDTDEGRDYWDALQIMREWTRRSHAALHDAAIESIGATVTERHWNEHNFLFREEDADGGLFWHAKGATPVHAPFLPDTTGTQIIPLNMNQPVLFVRGERNDQNMGFAPHGAGRNMSRTQHRLAMGDESIEAIFARETAGIDARFFSGKIDISELPSAYKDADRVQEEIARFGLCDVTDRILPHGAIMAGEQEQFWRKRG